MPAPPETVLDLAFYATFSWKKITKKGLTNALGSFKIDLVKAHHDACLQSSKVYFEPICRAAESTRIRPWRWPTALSTSGPSLHIFSPGLRRGLPRNSYPPPQRSVEFARDWMYIMFPPECGCTYLLNASIFYIVKGVNLSKLAKYIFYLVIYTSQIDDLHQ